MQGKNKDEKYRDISISTKQLKKGEDGHKTISVRMRDDMLVQISELSAQTNRSRNELINLLLEQALARVVVHDDHAE